MKHLGLAAILTVLTAAAFALFSPNLFFTEREPRPVAIVGATLCGQIYEAVAIYSNGKSKVLVRGEFETKKLIEDMPESQMYQLDICPKQQPAY